MMMMINEYFEDRLRPTQLPLAAAWSECAKRSRARQKSPQRCPWSESRATNHRYRSSSSSRRASPCSAAIPSKRTCAQRGASRTTLAFPEWVETAAGVGFASEASLALAVRADQRPERYGCVHWERRAVKTDTAMLPASLFRWHPEWQGADC